MRTVVDCSRDLTWPEALAVADSALRHGAVTREDLGAAAEAVPSTGRAQALRVARQASPLAANPFESGLRALALDVPGLTPLPQRWIEEQGFRGRPDLVDPVLRLVLEADSYAHHGGRAAFRKDCARYNALVIRGWTVLRFSWEDVVLRPDVVRLVLLAAIGDPSGRAALTEELVHAG